jgi:hypothetical protein
MIRCLACSTRFAKLDVKRPPQPCGGDPLRYFISHLRRSNYRTKTANGNYFLRAMASRLKRPGPNALIARLIDSSLI